MQTSESLNSSTMSPLERANELRRRGQWSESEEAYRRVIALADPGLMPLARWGLGIARYKQGAVDEAVELWHQAAASDSTDAGPRALNSLGVAYWDHGRIEDAKAAYQAAIASGHERAAWAARVNLGRTLKDEGDLDAAERLLREAAAGPHLDLRARAARVLGDVLTERGKTFEAVAAYTQAIEASPSEQSREALRDLGRLLIDEDAGAVRSAYERFIDSAEGETAAEAAMEFGELLEESGNWDGATAAYSRASTLGPPQLSARSALKRGQLLEAIGDWTGARSAYEEAINTGQSEAVGWARSRIENMLFSRRPEACQALESLLADAKTVPVDPETVRNLIKACDLIYALGLPAGDVLGEGQSLESDLLHFTADDQGHELVVLPLYTRPEFVRPALLRNPEWRTLFTLQVPGGSLLASLRSDVTIGLNLWTRLEFFLPPQNREATH